MKAIFLIQKVKKKRRKISSWTKEEDNLLISLVQAQQRKSWKKVTKILTNKTPYECYLRYRSINPNRRKGVWEPWEDQMILKAISLYGPRWGEIAKAIHTRNAKQIRERYINYLDPSIKQGKFSIDEDLLILDLHSQYGNRWSFIRKHYLPHRSADMIKNRFKSSISRNMKLYAVLKSLPGNEVRVF
jgi:hypothetical protein